MSLVKTNLKKTTEVDMTKYDIFNKTLFRLIPLQIYQIDTSLYERCKQDSSLCVRFMKSHLWYLKTTPI